MKEMTLSHPIHSPTGPMRQLRKMEYLQRHVPCWTFSGGKNFYSSNGCLVAKSCPTLLRPTGLLCQWNSPDKNMGMGCHFLLQGLFLMQGSNSCLLHWQVDSLPPSHQGSPYRCLVNRNICIIMERSSSFYLILEIKKQSHYKNFNIPQQKRCVT